MLQSLLGDRFNLVVRPESRNLPVYALVVARRDGKLGPGIRPAAVDCESITAKPLDSGTAQADYAGCMPQMGLAKLKATGFRMSVLASGVIQIGKAELCFRSSCFLLVFDFAPQR